MAKKLPKVVIIDYEINPEFSQRHAFIFGGHGKHKPKTRKELLRAMEVNRKFHLKEADYYKQKINELKKVV